jgi:hypothetical protein
MKTSYYYKYNFVSPESLFAEVKEELKSYFQTGVIDDVLFPKYTEYCLSRLGKSSYKIEENIFRVEDFKTTLPEDFKAVRELWLVTPHDMSYKMPNACYEQATVRVTPERDKCNSGDFCAPNEIKVTYKTQGTVIQRFNVHHLLKPGNVHARENCSLDSFNIWSDSMETFEVRGKSLLTNFPEGTLYMVYYIESFDENDFQLIPDNVRIQDYLKAYLKYKCFENIYNNISDETLNQVQQKLMYYEQKMLEAKEDAKNEIKMQTIEQQIRATKSARNRLRKFNIT